jgi:hypothetical protein
MDTKPLWNRFSGNARSAGRNNTNTNTSAKSRMLLRPFIENFVFHPGTRLGATCHVI